MKTGAELKARRLELGITQHDLAGNAGISRTQLSRMESGKIEISSEIMEILCDLLYAKHEKPKLQFSDLEVGDYVYVRDDLVDGKMYGEWSWHDDMQEGKRLKIEEIECGGYINDGMVYTPEMIDLSRSMKREDYLKMNKRELFASESFLKLIDVAGQAYKDGVITKYELHEHGIIIGSFNTGRKCDASNIIDWIESLYTEEFIIECDEDIERLKKDAELELKNGEVVCFNFSTDEAIKTHYFNDGKHSVIIPFVALKGATVKQLRGVK